MKTRRGIFGRFAAIYGTIWMAVLIGFAGISYPIMKKFAEDQMEARLRGILNAQVTVFSRKAEAIADSRLENPLIVHPFERPEIEAALNKEVGSSIRYSQLDRRRMAFVAYPHLRLGNVESVIRIGVPYASFDYALWRAYLEIAAAGFGLAIAAAALSSIFTLYRADIPLHLY